jgi:predicted metal-dependent hydrolase
MVEVLNLGDVLVDVVFKDIKNVHLSVYPPTGRVRIAAPQHMSLDSVRLFAVSKIGWIRKHQRKVRQQPRETPREFLERESHQIWGRRYLLHIEEGSGPHGVQIGARQLTLHMPAGSTVEQRREALESWSRTELRQKAVDEIDQWERRLGVKIRRFYVQQMRTRWGTSNPRNGTIRLNLDLARFPPECLRYVVLHELAHFVVPSHNEHFQALLDQHMPGWQAIRARLNEGPLRAL